MLHCFQDINKLLKLADVQYKAFVQCLGLYGSEEIGDTWLNYNKALLLDQG